MGDMIEVEGLRRTFGAGENAVHAVEDVSFAVPEGQLCAIVGRSGSGKTTLLNLIGGLDKPDAGRIAVDGKQLAGPGRNLGEKELAALRRDLFGFVFQSFGLIPILSAAENVGIPLRLRRTPVAEREQRVELLLNMVGLGGHAKQRPGEMSGGQQQRVALARALANSPRVLIADEPTGQLDSETGRAVMRLLRAVVAAENVTALVATHDPLMIELADRVITVGDGRLLADSDAEGAGVGRAGVGARRRCRPRGSRRSGSQTTARRPRLADFQPRLENSDPHIVRPQSTYPGPLGGPRGVGRARPWQPSVSPPMRKHRRPRGLRPRHTGARGDDPAACLGRGTAVLPPFPVSLPSGRVRPRPG